MMPSYYLGYKGYREGDTITNWHCAKCNERWVSDDAGLCKFCGCDPKIQPTVPRIQRLTGNGRDRKWEWVKL